MSAPRRYRLALLAYPRAATWVALRILGWLAPGTRRRALSVCLVLSAAVAISQSWLRPDLETGTPRSFTGGYAQSSFADLGSATLLANQGPR